MKYDLYKILYGSKFLYFYMQDTILELLAERDSIPLKTLQGTDQIPPADFERVIGNLVEDKMIIISEYSAGITLKGKMKVASGGYRKESLFSACVITVNYLK
jgi:hypothetical protein